MKKINAQLLLKVPGREPVPVKTNIPCTLVKVVDNKMVAYCDANEVTLTENVHNKKRIIEAWNGWSKDSYEVVWDGTGDKGLTKSQLPNQKGLLMGDYNGGGSSTAQIMEHIQMMSIDDTVDPTEHSKKKKKHER